ncbi:MAG: helix-turn-helix transcriptional regulator [Siphonobacter sp.]
MKHILNKIRAIRLEKGFSQEYMGFSLSISQTSYSRIEAGSVNLEVKQLYNIAGVLEVDVELLLGKPENVSIAQRLQNIEYKLDKILKNSGSFPLTEPSASKHNPASGGSGEGPIIEGVVVVKSLIVSYLTLGLTQSSTLSYKS